MHNSVWFSCLQCTFEFVCYINVLWRICKIYIYIAMSGFNVRLVNVLVSFKFLSMSCVGSFHWPFHYKKLILSNKNICWDTYLCSCHLFVSFSRAVNYIFFHILILHCKVVLVYKKKIMMILLYFKFTRTLVFTICPTVMPIMEIAQ